MSSKIECVCGSKIYSSRYEAHLLTKKHTTYMSAYMAVENDFNTEETKVIETPLPPKPTAEDECGLCLDDGICADGFFTCSKCKQRMCLDCQDKCDKCPFCRTTENFQPFKRLADSVIFEGLEDYNLPISVWDVSLPNLN